MQFPILNLNGERIKPVSSVSSFSVGALTSGIKRLDVLKFVSIHPILQSKRIKRIQFCDESRSIGRNEQGMMTSLSNNFLIFVQGGGGYGDGGYFPFSRNVDVLESRH